MSPSVRDEETGQLLSTRSCDSCRQRKIKCSRELPRCVICERSSKECTYPERTLKPGPKVGSSQGQRKRRRESAGNQLLDASSKALRRTSDDSHQSNRDDEDSIVPTSSTQHPNDIQTLSFIIHPSHESCSPEQHHETVMSTAPPDDDETLVGLSCYTLGIEPQRLKHLVEKYFESFPSFQLFREPYLETKLHNIGSEAVVTALLASMFSFIVKGNLDDFVWAQNNSTLREQWSGSYFNALAMKYVDQAINECGDEPWPLSLLQALILTVHWLLIRAVRGRAWRYLGICVRSAYELNLHLVDSGKELGDTLEDRDQWAEDEERRRTWWAIWEMDVFASAIRRSPTAIDWSQNETFLPVNDDFWFRADPQPSCVLEISPVDRWKTLEASGNQSAKAWFIVINSLMKDAQNISSPIGVDKSRSRRQHDATKNGGNRLSKPGLRAEDKTKESINRLSILRNCLYCAVLALPPHLKYQYKSFSFGERCTDRDDMISQRLLHSSIYSIHMMTQLTKLMIYKYYIFRNGLRWPQLSKEAPKLPSRSEDIRVSQRYALEQYLEAADEINALVRRSNESQHRYVNPFLANTIWLAAAVKILHREIAPAGSDKDLLNSDFELMYQTWNQFVKYWEMSTTLEKNLEVLVRELRDVQNSSSKHLDGGEPGAAGSKATRTNVIPYRSPLETSEPEAQYRGQDLGRRSDKGTEKLSYSRDCSEIKVPADHPVGNPSPAVIPETSPPAVEFQMNGEGLSFASQAPDIMSPDTGPQMRNQLQLSGVSNGASGTSLFDPSTGASMESDSNQAFPSMNHLSQAPLGSSFAAPGFQPMLSSDFFDPFPLDGNLDLDLLNEILFDTLGS